MLLLSHRECLFRLFVFLVLGIRTSTAAISFTTSFDSVIAGAPYNLTWSGAQGTTTLTLQDGSSNDLNTVGVIASGIKDSFFVWTPNTTTPTGTYFIRLDDTTGVQRISSQFTILPVGTKSTSTVSPASGSTPVLPESVSTISGLLTTVTNLPSTSLTTSSEATSSATAVPSSAESLSIGARAGVGVGASMGTIALSVVVLYFIFFRRRNKNTAKEVSELSMMGGAKSPDLLRADVVTTYQEVNQLPGPAEISEHNMPSEMAAVRERSELYSPDKRYK